MIVDLEGKVEKALSDRDEEHKELEKSLNEIKYLEGKIIAINEQLSVMHEECGV